MKMTIVIDTDDANGIEDAYKMVHLMYAKYVRATSSYGNRSFGKIEFIKLLRKFGREAVESYEYDDDFDLKAISSLKFTKTFADIVWRESKE